MKLKTNQLIWSAVLTIFALGFTACADLEEVSPTLDAEAALYDIPTTIDRMQNGIPSNAGAANERRNPGPTFSTLNAALGSTGLASVFSRNDLTAFAPTDAAFAELGLNPGNVRNLPGLRDILLYHVVAGTVLSTDLTNTFVQTVNGQFIGISADDLTINGANIVAADIRARNGVIHAIDAVLLPPSQNIVEVALGNENFSILVEAVIAAGFVELLATTNDLTVFAPTNDAFVDLLGELGFGSLEELIDEEGGIGLAGLQGVLAYHVFAGRVFSTDLSNGTITMFSGDEVTVDVSGPSLIDQNDRTSGIVATDIQATNGVIHVIDKVILP